MGQFSFSQRHIPTKKKMSTPPSPKLVYFGVAYMRAYMVYIQGSLWAGGKTRRGKSWDLVSKYLYLNVKRWWLRVKTFSCWALLIWQMTNAPQLIKNSSTPRCWNWWNTPVGEEEWYNEHNSSHCIIKFHHLLHRRTLDQSEHRGVVGVKLWFNIISRSSISILFLFLQWLMIKRAGFFSSAGYVTNVSVSTIFLQFTSPHTLVKIGTNFALDHWKLIDISKYCVFKHGLYV